MNILLVCLEDHGVVLNMLGCLHAHTIFVLGSTQKSSLSYSRRCRYYYTPVQEGDLFAEYINEFCALNNIEIIIPTDMQSFFKLSGIQSQLERKLFITDSLEMLTLLHDKRFFYEFMTKNDILTPHTNVISKKEDIHRFPCSFPVMIKPFDQSGLRGILKLSSYDEIKKHIDSDSPFSSPPLLVQDFIDGTDIDVSVLAGKGKIVAYTIQKWYENGVLQFVDDNKALTLAQKIVEKLSFSGVAHFDMREERRTKKIYVLECNPRFWGSIAASYMAGVDFIGLGVQATLIENKTFVIPEYKKGYYVLISVIHRLIVQMKWKYFSKSTIRTVLDVLSDPLPFLITQFHIVFSNGKV